MGDYDRINKLKQKHESEKQSLYDEIASLKEKNERLSEEIDQLRQERYAAGLGQGKVNKLENTIVGLKRDLKTLENKFNSINGSKLVSSFNAERQELIRKIKNLEFYNNGVFNSLATRFKNGLDNVIEIAYRIKNNIVKDMDYFTFVFRDDIVGLLEKMLHVVIGEKEESASKYLVKLNEGTYSLPKEYYDRIPALKDKGNVFNILALINVQTTGYHGTQTKYKRVIIDKESGDITKPERFFNLDNEQQLRAIFTLLEFMYYVFTNRDSETNLINISQCWFKTM